MEYRDASELRTKLYKVNIGIDLLVRSISIIFFAKALHRFRQVFQEVEKESGEELQPDKKSFYMHLFMIIAYFFTLALITVTFIFIGYEPWIWLVAFYFVDILTLFNYIFILLVTSNMWIHYQEKLRHDAVLANAIDSDIKSRYNFIKKEIE